MTRITQGTNGITQGFSSKHKGIDIGHKGGDNDNILAHSSGTIVDVCTTHNKNDKTGSSYGNYIKIKHFNGYYTLYAHLEKVYVKKGQVVEQGQVIGYMGNTGRSTAKHLHFEVRNEKNIRINPTEYRTKNLPNSIKYKTGNYVVESPRYVRNGAGTEYAIKKVSQLTKDGQNQCVNKKPNADAQYKKGTIFTALEIIIAKNGGYWAKTPSGYVCIESCKGTKYCKRK